MTHYYKTLSMTIIAGSLVTLTGCIVEPDKYNAHSASNESYNQPHNASSSHSAASKYDRGCSDAKAGSYDRSGNAGQAYEDGWDACHNGVGNQSGTQPHNANSSHSAASKYDLGCSDAKAGSYDRSGHGGQAYEDGWNACHNGGGNQRDAQQQGGEEDAKSACLFQFGSSGRVQTVSDLKPGFWEIIVTNNSGRKVACTAGSQGKVIDWVEM